VSVGVLDSVACLRGRAVCTYPILKGLERAVRGHAADDEGFSWRDIVVEEAFRRQVGDVDALHLGHCGY